MPYHDAPPSTNDRNPYTAGFQDGYNAQPDHRHRYTAGTPEETRYIDGLREGRQERQNTLQRLADQERRRQDDQR